MARKQEHLADGRLLSARLWQIGLSLIRVYSCPFAVDSSISGCLPYHRAHWPHRNV